MLKKFVLAILAITYSVLTSAADNTYTFGVLSQRSAVLTAQYWNPILTYIEQKTQVKLILTIARSAPESNDATEKGVYDFVYSNTIFLPKMADANYQVILRPQDEAITGQIVTLADSPIHTLKDLDGKEVGFPSLAAFVGYAVPMDQLLRAGITVTPVFGGNQEGIMGQLRAKRVIAAGVNNQVMKAFAAREGFSYRVLWESVGFHNLPISVHPRIDKNIANTVKTAFDGMENDPEGLAILEMSAKLIGQKAPFGFRASSQEDYKSYTDFYQHTLVKDIK
jgi:phosphonate transport system substrate-binding protein